MKFMLSYIFSTKLNFTISGTAFKIYVSNIGSHKITEKYCILTEVIAEDDISNKL